MADEGSEVKYRVSRGVEIILLIFAFIFYIFGIVPGLNIAIDIIANTFFFIIFNFLLGVPTFGPRTWLWYVAAWVIELIPFVSIFPIEIIAVFRMVEISRLEDQLAATDIGRAALEAQQVQRAMKRGNDEKKIADAQKNAEARSNKTDERRPNRFGQRSPNEQPGPGSQKDYLTGGEYNPNRYGPAARFAKPADAPKGSRVDGIAPAANDNAVAAPEEDIGQAA